LAARSESPASAAGQRFGLGLAATAATGLGLAVALSRLAYDGGSNGLTVATIRAVVLLAGLALFCRLSGRSLRLSRHDTLHCIGLGLLMSLAFYGNIGAVEYISVGLTALLFYTFPPMVALIQILVIGERVGWPQRLAIVAAFAGLATMLGDSLSIRSSPLGVTLALGAAASVAWSSVWLARKLPGRDPLVLTLYMAGVASLVLLVITLGGGQWQLPHSAGGWLGTALVVSLQASSIPLYFLAIPRIGPLRSAMVSNVQPLVSIVAAMLLYAELLTPQQYLGGAVVVGAVIWMQRADARERGA
jgi:DME family drug/metabolite transporter